MPHHRAEILMPPGSPLYPSPELSFPDRTMLPPVPPVCFHHMPALKPLCGREREQTGQEATAAATPRRGEADATVAPLHISWPLFPGSNVLPPARSHCGVILGFIPLLAHQRGLKCKGYDSMYCRDQLLESKILDQLTTYIRLVNLHTRY